MIAQYFTTKVNSSSVDIFKKSQIDASKFEKLKNKKIRQINCF